MNRSDLRSALDHPNVKAFLAVIRAGEGTDGLSGYRTLFGGNVFIGADGIEGTFDDFSGHPNKLISHRLGSRVVSSTAAGAYQFLNRTWEGLVKQYGFTDFSATSQDEGAVALIAGRKALEPLMSGRFREAVGLCAREWASLPGSPYGQPTISMDKAEAIYIFSGGSMEADDGREAMEVKPMAPFIAAALPALIQAAPSLIRAFGSSPQAEKNAKAAEVVASIAKQATGQETVEGAVNAIQTDPAQAAAYREAVHQSMDQLVALSIQVSEAEDRSRDLALDRNLQLAKASNGRWLWLLGGIAFLVIVASYGITAGVIFGGSTFSDETKALLLGQVIIAGFVTVLAWLFGSSISSRIRDAKEQA